MIGKVPSLLIYTKPETVGRQLLAEKVLLDSADDYSISGQRLAQEEMRLIKEAWSQKWIG